MPDNKISQTEAAHMLGITVAAIGKLTKKIPRPGYFVDVGKKIKIDIEHPEWRARYMKAELAGKAQRMRNKKSGEAVAKARKLKAKIETETEKPEVKKEIETEKKIKIKYSPEESDLAQQSLRAEFKKNIYTAQIKEEQAKQNQIKTFELKKDLAPISLIKHFFSFAENMAQRLYRRPHEIGPQIKALYLAGEDRKAEQLYMRELEGIVIDMQKQLIADMKAEGYKKVVKK